MIKYGQSVEASAPAGVREILILHMRRMRVQAELLEAANHLQVPNHAITENSAVFASNADESEIMAGREGSQETEVLDARHYDDRVMDMADVRREEINEMQARINQIVAIINASIRLPSYDSGRLAET
ncbi:hypothetical protein MPER_06204 [Moniliophthora perniciosa FA553]|nr:hypothetical protein MPER_06204 [Moniliophthora perniciosa FA553]